ncbi:hypothetical protein [Micromonospora okii]|uniref:hypothetical protein n=1 Tax=Micromonospora okii TaxID=1182970 RepID=UPI001E374BF7|nr:hypothetical protein [Micromonospora okii]
MREDLTFAERMRRDLLDVRWPEPAELRARARRRSRRTAMVAATAVLAVTSVAAVLAGRPAAPPTTSWPDRWLSAAAPEPSGRVAMSAAAPEPSGRAEMSAVAPERSGRAEIPPEALLASTDVRVSSNVVLSDTGLREPVRVDPLLEACANARGLRAVQAVSRYSRSQTLLQDDTPGSDGPSGVMVLTQDIYRLADGAAAGLFSDLDRAVTGCAGWRGSAPRGGGTGTTAVSVAHTWAAVARDFAGDQAVLLRQTLSEPLDATTGRPVDRRLGTWTWLLIRVGDLVTVIVPASGLGADGPGDIARRTSDAELLELGQVAARRMCFAANPSC